ncbi:MAG: hypothetical protein LBD07_01185 [Spirochaetaceae bacterium]|jgi:transposase|nr:hypothetical protein [Spirochaetaceae bacterium]
MTEKQNRVYTLIKDVVNGICTTREIAQKLGLSVRRVQQLVLLLRKYGKKAFIHGNTNKHPANYTSEETRKRIIGLVQSDIYANCNIRQIKEKLKENNILISYNTLRILLKNANIGCSRKYNINMIYKDADLIKGFHVFYTFTMQISFFKERAFEVLYVMYDAESNVVSGLCLCETQCIEGFRSVLDQTYNEYKIIEDVYVNKYKNKYAKAFCEEIYNENIALFPVMPLDVKRKIRLLRNSLEKELAFYFALYGIKSYTSAKEKLVKFKAAFNFKNIYVHVS